MYEYKLTRRKGRIISRRMFVYRWTIEATTKRAKYHETKNGKTYLKLPIQSKPKPSKEELLALRPFSDTHHKLIDELYSQESKSMQILKKNAENYKHLIDIENMSAKLKAYKSSLKLKNPKNMLYRIETYYTDDKQKVKTLSVEHVSNEPEVNYLANINRTLSKYPNYHHLSVKDRKDNVLTIMVNCAA